MVIWNSLGFLELLFIFEYVFVGFYCLNIMRFLFKSICKCFGLFDDEAKPRQDTSLKDENNSTTLQSSKPAASEIVFRVKETRQRSVDYVVHSPRFGIQDCTGGTDNIH